MKKEKIVGIYSITSPSNKTYIGKAVDINKRWKLYELLHCKSQPKLYHSFLKYGVANHVFEIICECEESELLDLEIDFIHFFDTFNTPYGLNLTPGGQSGIVSPESLEKRRKSLTGKKHTDETKKKISEKNSGRKMDEETKEKIRVAMTGRKFSDETIQKMKKSGGKHLKGKKQTPEHIEKLAQQRRGKKIPDHVYESLRNRNITDEEREAISRRVQEWWDKRHAEGKEGLSEEAKQNMSIARKKWWDSLTEEQRVEICKKRRGKKRNENHKKNHSIGSKSGWAKRKGIDRLKGWKKRKDDPSYYSEKEIQKRSDAVKRAHITRKENEEKRIEQERRTMIF